jgi:mRNA deadenylase 3'-5' endonuclease subunit Ccr4
MFSYEHAVEYLFNTNVQVSQPILVCSAHIHWDPEFCDVKLIQTMMLMEQLRQIVESCHNLRFAGEVGSGSRLFFAEFGSRRLVLYPNPEPYPCF